MCQIFSLNRPANSRSRTQHSAPSARLRTSTTHQPQTPTHHLIRLCITTAIARATADTVGAIHLGRPRIDLRCITPSCAR